MQGNDPSLILMQVNSFLLGVALSHLLYYLIMLQYLWGSLTVLLSNISLIVCTAV